MSEAKILIVDDEPAVRLGIKRALEKKGYTLYEASDGAEGLKLIAEVQSSHLEELPSSRPCRGPACRSTSRCGIEAPVPNGLKVRRRGSEPRTHWKCVRR